MAPGTEIVGHKAKGEKGMNDAWGDRFRDALADKTHNTATILADLGTDGAAVCGRFTGGREGSLWYHHALGGFCRAFARNAGRPI